MYSLNCSRNDLKMLIHQLKHQGLEENMLFGFIMTLKSWLIHNPDKDYLQINEYLPLRGWNHFKLDAQTFQIARACFKNGNQKRVHLSGQH